MQEKVSCFANILIQVNQDIQKRNGLSETVIKKIYEHYSYLKSKLFEMYLWPVGGNRAIETRRSGLEQQLNDLNQQTREEKIKAWNDVAILKKEFRTWFKQYSDLKQRVKLVLPEKPRKPTKNIFLL